MANDESASQADESDVQQQAVAATITLGNEFVGKDNGSSLREVGNGFLMGAIHFWLYAQRPCDKPECEECEPISTTEKRLSVLLAQVQAQAENSSYFELE